MFLPYQSEVNVSRKECCGNIDKVLKRNHAIAKRVMINDLLKKPRSNKRVINEHEKILRIEVIKPFLEEWNALRYEYTESIKDWLPVTKSQITVIEKIIKLCDDNYISLNVFLCCAFMSWKNNPEKLSINMVLAHGLEYYDRYSDQVFARMDDEISQMRSYGFNF